MFIEGNNIDTRDHNLTNKCIAEGENPLDHITLVRFDQDAWGMVAGVVLQLQKAGVSVAVEDDWMAMYTPAFAAAGRESLEIAIVGGAEHARLSRRQGDRVISSRGPLFAHLVSR